MLIVSSLVSLAFTAGCSGGGKSGTPGTIPTPTPTPTPVPATPVAVKASIFWGPRSRAATTSSGLVTGPSSALSAVITLKGASTSGGDLTVTAVRDTTQVSGYTGTYTLGPGLGTPGSNFALHVDFYAAANATGSIVATADTAVGGAAINKDGTLNDIITTTGTIQSVVLGDVSINGTAQNGSLQVGQTADVTYAAFDGPNGTGNLIAITPGSGFVTVVSGTAALTAQGDKVVASAPTTGATISVTVDPGIGGGITSPTKTIKVLSATAVVLAATNPPGGTASAPIDSPGIPLTITATVTGDPSNSGAGAGVTFLLKEGSSAGTLTATTTPTASVVYTPPTTLPTAPVTYHIVATSNYDPNVTVTIPITIQSLVTVSITPSTTQTISIKSTQQFNGVASLVPTGSDSGVTYAVTDSTGAAITTGGTISSSGLYTSPSTPGTYYIKATSNFDPSKSALVPVVVKSLGVISVTSPTQPVAAISIKSTLQFTQTVTGIPTGQSTAVTYAVQEGAAGGTISSTGLYTAPATPGTYHIVITSVFDPTVSVTVAVPVQSFVKLVVTPNPVAPISIKSTLQFSSSVTGVAAGGSTGVTYSVQESTGGTITSTGLTAATYTAPSTPGTYHVIVTSVFDPTVSVTVAVPVQSFVTVAVSPSAVALSINQTQQFTATVAGVAAGGATTVVWSITDANGNATTVGGTVSANGLYTAPGSVSNASGTVFHVVATSTFDPTKSGFATVTVGSGSLGIGVN